MHQHRILLLEDEPELAELLTELLEELRFEVESVGTMADALAALEAGPQPCAIIADLTLPDVPRDQVVERLRARGGSASVILMSAIPASELERLGREQEVDRIIAKPFDLEDFEEALTFGCGQATG